jgi:hypothetical protein
MHINSVVFSFRLALTILLFLNINRDYRSILICWKRLLYLTISIMPRTYTPVLGSSRRRQYSEEAMQRAIDDVNGGMSQRDAAAAHSVPRQTMADKIKGKHRLSSGGQPVFTEAEEITIAKNIATLGDWGFPVNTTDVRLMVKHYLEVRGRRVSKFKSNLPGTDWMSCFLKRRSDIISQRMCQNICRKRAEISADNVEQYFDHLSHTLSDVPATNIINYDETNLCDNPGQKKCVFRRGCKYPERVLNSTKASTSVMFSATASGVLLPAYVVYKAEHLHDRWIEGGPDDVRYNRSKSGWFDSTCFSDWFNSVVVPFCRRLDGKKVLLGDNLASHFSESVVSKCEELDIAFVCLPPNSTHMCQPLDVSVYAPMKKYWRRVLGDWKNGPGRALPTLPKEWFPRLLSQLLDAMKPTVTQNIINGFKACGICPPDKDRVLTRIKRSQPCADDQNAISGAVSDVVLAKLAELQQGSQPERKRKKRLAVVPGKSISLADFAGPSTSSGVAASKQVAGRKTSAKRTVPEEDSESDSEVPAASDDESEDSNVEDDTSGSDSDNGDGSEERSGDGIADDNSEDDHSLDASKDKESNDASSSASPPPGSYVLVRFKPRTGEPYHYVGKVVSNNVKNRTHFVDFLRISGECFMFPVVSDKANIDDRQLVETLTLSDVRHGRHRFADSDILKRLIVR